MSAVLVWLRARSWLLPFVLGAAALGAGWWQTRFLCDDAFIAFRYVGNAYDGHGLVWNPAPFGPVEGYSCFLWVIVLWVVWLLTTIPPPQSANVLALLCALGTLFLVARRATAATYGADARRVPVWVVSLTMLGAASNATFVTWASSGLETAMFGLFAVGWTLAATALYRQPTRRALLTVSTWAALAALTRPDGALLAAATLMLAGHSLLGRRATLTTLLAALSPLLAPVLHLLWRRSYYGEWVPNTYYAKVVAAWPESGMRYLYCFVVEHGIWLWTCLALVWLVVAALRGASVRALATRGFPAVVAIGTWLVYVGYYTVAVGGDHFGWRPFAHLVPLLFWSCQWLVAGIGWRPRMQWVLLVAFAAVANSLGWWFEAKLAGRERDGFVRASTRLPAPLAGFMVDYDRLRAWLRLHFVALPRGLHARSCEDLLVLLPERRAGLVDGLAAYERGVYRTVAAGVVGWALADIAIIDAVGLNDRFVARHPERPQPAVFDAAQLGPAFAVFDRNGDQRLDGLEIIAAAPLAHFDTTGVLVSPAGWAELLLALCDRNGDGLDASEFADAVAELQDQRHMAHERVPPPGYLEALRPNVVLRDGGFHVVADVLPLTNAEVRAIEERFRARMGR